MFGIVHIPTTSDATDGKSTYTVFNIHLNGAYHSSLRYSQLLTFHQEVRSAVYKCVTYNCMITISIFSVHEARNYSALIKSCVYKKGVILRLSYGIGCAYSVVHAFAMTLHMVSCKSISYIIICNDFLLGRR